MPGQSFRDLLVWQKSIDFVVDIYELTKRLPYFERFGISSQLQRAAVSVASNIAEGSRRRTKRDFSNFCAYANGSAAEIETQLLILNRLYPQIETAGHINRVIELQKMLTNLIKSLDSCK